MANFLNLDGLRTFLGKLDARYGATLTLANGTAEASQATKSTVTASLVNKNGTALTSASLDLPASSSATAGTMSASSYTKLSGIATGAQVNVLESVKVNGTALTVSSKAVNIDLSGYLTSSSLSGYVQSTDLSAVATSGSYTDLTGKPTVDATLSTSSSNAIANSAVATALAAKADASALTAKADASELSKYALKAEVASAVTYKGSVATYSALPSTNQSVGDMYNVQADDSAHSVHAGDNVVWTGTEWDNVSGFISVSIDSISDTQIDALFTAS